ncbi:MAG TPA: M15 family metallopeptidase [Longimicrobiaceae bacterium]|nr:M15 family metallopeptidase [Longimicrobiaceae bacterium]
MRPSRILPLYSLVLLSASCPGVGPNSGPESCALPPGEELVLLNQRDSTLRFDIRYATDDNFTGRRLPGYEYPRALLRPRAADALVRVQARLRREGLGLKVFDAYRPIRATQAMVLWANRSGNQWVLEQGYVARQSGHNRGATVDLTVVRLDTGRELDMGTAYDTFSEAAHTANATGAVRENRQKLLRAMDAEGWVNYSKEWWHFSHPGDYSALDLPLRCWR